MKNTTLHRRQRLHRPATHQVSLPSSRRFIFFLLHRRRSSSSESGTLFIIHVAVLYGRSAVSLRATQTCFFFFSFFLRLSTRVLHKTQTGCRIASSQPPHASSAVAAQNSLRFKRREVNPHKCAFHKTAVTSVTPLVMSQGA